MTDGAPTNGATLQGAARESYVERMFDRIARPYDDLNRLISWGRDRAWRREALVLSGATAGSRVVDLGCGTGDFCVEAARVVGPEGEVVGVDLSEGMLAVARAKLSAEGATRARVVRGNAAATGLSDGKADAVTLGFVLRNVGERASTYKEILRVLRPGGRVVVLETSRPESALVRAGFAAYLRLVMPIVVRLRGGDAEAYRYLAESTSRFLTARELTAELRAAGFAGAACRTFMCGTIALHVASRPAPAARDAATEKSR